MECQYSWSMYLGSTAADTGTYFLNEHKIFRKMITYLI